MRIHPSKFESVFLARVLKTNIEKIALSSRMVEMKYLLYDTTLSPVAVMTTESGLNDRSTLSFNDIHRLFDTCSVLSLCLLPRDGRICVTFALPLLYIECTVWSYILHGCLPTLTALGSVVLIQHSADRAWR